MSWFTEAIPNLTDSDKQLLTDHIEEIRDRVDLMVLGGIGAGEALIAVCKEYLSEKSVA